MRDGLTIGRAAAFLGITPKTIRHYERLGLATEPSRNASGYRVYFSEDLVRIAQVRTLSLAGVPLAEVPDVLAGDDVALTRRVSALDESIAAQIDALQARRRSLHLLRAGDALLLPERAVGVLRRLEVLEFDPVFIDLQREGLVLAMAVAPDLFDAYVTQLSVRLDDPEHVRLLQQSWEAEGLDPDDPRLEALADSMVANLLARPENLVAPASLVESTDGATRYALVDQHRAAQWPTSARLAQLIERKLAAAGFTFESPPSPSTPSTNRRPGLR